MAARSVDVWAGFFDSEARCERYLEENYGDLEPLSEFAGDMGESFYDHDLFEFSFHSQPTDDIELLLQDHSYTKLFASKAQIAFEARKCVVNVVFMMWNEGQSAQLKAPKSVTKADVKLIYVGRFACGQSDSVE